MALAGGELAHIGGAKIRTRALFLKTKPKKKWFLSPFPLQFKNFLNTYGGNGEEG